MGGIGSLCFGESCRSLLLLFKAIKLCCLESENTLFPLESLVTPSLTPAHRLPREVVGFWLTDGRASCRPASVFGKGQLRESSHWEKHHLQDAQTLGCLVAPLHHCPTLRFVLPASLCSSKPSYPSHTTVSSRKLTVSFSLLSILLHFKTGWLCKASPVKRVVMICLESVLGYQQSWS